MPEFLPERTYAFPDDIFNRLAVAEVGWRHLHTALYGDVARFERHVGAGGLILCAHLPPPGGWLIVECAETSTDETWSVETARWADDTESRILTGLRNQGGTP